MSYQVPVIVSDIPANLEVGLPEKDYFPMGDVDALASKLEDIIAEPAHHVAYDMSKYDWDKIAEQFAEIYRKFTKWLSHKYYNLNAHEFNRLRIILV